ncbi:MAG: nucleotidyltransferase [Nitrospira sp.]|nr:nucleotidyltransferase [Nitrospira sp.]
MLFRDKQKLSDLLLKTAKALDIPDQAYEDATIRYEDVGTWLGEDDSELKDYAPEIYPQGSFRLGTVVQPISGLDEYDIDLVCHLNLPKERITQKDLKKMVGNRLAKREDLKKILIPSRRCWVLKYPAQAQMPKFHMDILPAIPNHERPPMGILLTDTELRLWQKSNPKAYSEWFYERMKVAFSEKRDLLAKEFQVTVEDVPEWQVKTPLQVAIQVLKRHRDIHFQHDPENRPVSIIITTLSAYAYRNQADIYDAFTDIIRDMPNFVNKKNGRWRVDNPVDPDENFADKWNEYPHRQLAFAKWLDKVQLDFSAVSQKENLNEALDFLTPSFGASIMAKAAKNLGITRPTAFSLVATKPIQVPALGSTAHCLPPAWPVTQKYKATLTASVHLKKNGKKLWQLTGRPVPKKVWLRFGVTTNTPQPYDVRWQVVNTGKEAADDSALRGDFYMGDVPGNNVHWESTLYRGTHWVEAFIIKNAACVARSGRKNVLVR